MLCDIPRNLTIWSRSGPVRFTGHRPFPSRVSTISSRTFIRYGIQATAWVPAVDEAGRLQADAERQGGHYSRRP
jgi:hypothetical protein